MAYKTSIEITDHNSAGVCTTSYAVDYKAQSDTDYVPLPDQFNSPIEVGGLEDSTDYDIRITRRCCNGLISTPVIVPVSQTTPTPANFVATNNGSEVDLTWDEVIQADGYEIERADDAGFTIGNTTLYTGVYTPVYTDASVSPTTTYYYRIKAERTGYPDSAYATTSILTL